jgi:energy-coupling factor transport system ATP-binding protein
MLMINRLRFRGINIPSLVISPGRTAVIGPNGSGKTTLLRIIAGLAIPESGEILVDGVAPRETEVGWVHEFPDRNLLFSRVSDELASPLRFRGLKCSETKRRVEELAGLAGIEDLLNRLTGTLSGGEKALISLLTALAHRPLLLVLDEFDSHLDAAGMERAGKIIGEAGCRYVIQCTQQMDLVTGAANVIYLKEGSPLFQGTPTEVFSRLSNTCFYPPAWRLRDAAHAQ